MSLNNNCGEMSLAWDNKSPMRWDTEEAFMIKYFWSDNSEAAAVAVVVVVVVVPALPFTMDHMTSSWVLWCQSALVEEAKR